MWIRIRNHLGPWIRIRNRIQKKSLFYFKICKYLISFKTFYCRKKSWWFYVPLSVLFSSYGGSANIYHLSVIKSYVDSNPDPSGLPKEQRKNLIVVVSQTLVSKYLLTSYYYIEHSNQHYYIIKGQLISEELILVWFFFTIFCSSL